MGSTISKITAREILDSRGNPTVEVDVKLNSGDIGRAAVPSGASTGTREALELRDGAKDRYFGKGVAIAVRNVNRIIAPHVVGLDVKDQKQIDYLMIEMDDTPNKSNLGANAMLGVSLAVAKAAANYEGRPLYRHLMPRSCVLPVPLMNILNGGVHADNNVDIQEFMIAPLGASFSDSLQMGVETYHTLKKVLKRRGLSTSVGDEGGFAPDLKDNEEAVRLIMEAIEEAGYAPGKDISMALDVAASELFKDGKYSIKVGKKEKLTIEKTVEFFEELCDDYPIISIEDPMSESDWKGWKLITEALGDSVQLVGDDIFVTNREYCRKASRKASRTLSSSRSTRSARSPRRWRRWISRTTRAMPASSLTGLERRRILRSRTSLSEPRQGRSRQVHRAGASVQRSTTSSSESRKTLVDGRSTSARAPSH